MRPDEDYVRDILSSAEHLASRTHGRDISSLDDRSYHNDIVREVQIIGEACRALSDEFKDARPSIPWRAIVSMRHILVHAYHVIDNLAVWEAATVDVPELVRLLSDEPVTRVIESDTTDD